MAIRRLISAVALSGALALPSGAGAFTIGPGSQPGLALDAAGNAYIAWNGPENPPALQFCRLPRGATACDIQHAIAAPGSTTTRPFLAVSGTAVSVVQYRYPLTGSDPPAATLEFSSSDSGATFGAGRTVGTLPFFDAVTGPGATMSGVTDSETVEGGAYQNVQLGGSSSSPYASLSSDHPYQGAIGMLDAATPLAVFTDGSDHAIFRRYDGSGSVNDTTNWTPAEDLGVAAKPRLAYGPTGLFLFAVAPDRTVFARKWTENAFGPPVSVAADANAPTLAAFEDQAGRLHVVFQRGDANGANLIHAASDDGVTWQSTTLMTQGPGDGGFGDPRVATAADHLGVAVWADGSPGPKEIRVAALEPGQGVEPPQPEYSTCESVRVIEEHGKPMPGNAQLSEIKRGKVLVVGLETGKTRKAKFRRNAARHKRVSGRWLESNHGDFALAGQAISRSGEPGGRWVIASKAQADDGVTCKAPLKGQPKRDTAAAESSGTNLPASAVEETPTSASNASGMPLVNPATREVCTNSPNHPDGAMQSSHPSAAVWCFIGPGAGLNDPYGTERQPLEAPYYGHYYVDTNHTHKIIYNNAIVPAAKRPSVKPNGSAVITNSPIVWRPVAYGVRVAN